MRRSVGCVGVLQVGGEWWTGGAEEALGPPLGPGENSVGIRGCLLTPGPTQGGTGAARVPATIRWE